MSRLHLAILMLAVAGCSPDGPVGNEVAVNLTPQSRPTASARTAGAASHALLVGCTSYPNLPIGQQLSGPRNDVALFSDLLTQRFGLSKNNVAILCEGRGERERPTRSHIEREFIRLAKVVDPGSQVVILLAGHGCQQPTDPNDPADFEADGFDEVFCPADITPASEDEPDRIPNAITDDELRRWLQAILDKGALVWLIVDACHAGTMTRGFETTREIPPSELVKADRLEQARTHAAHGWNGKSAPSDSHDTPIAGSGNLVALFASQPDEVTVEKTLPEDVPDSKSHGLLTYTLNQVLRQSTGPLTYRELVQRVHRRYVQAGRTFPTPMLEGDGRDREVLGLREWPGRSRIALYRDAESKHKINAGAVHDMNPGTVLAVFPPAGQVKFDKPLGHVMVTQAALLEAWVEPCAHGDMPTAAVLPDEGRCKVVHIDYGLRTIRVAVDSRTEAGETVPADVRRQLKDELKRLEQDQQSLVTIVEDPRQADWLLRVQSMDARPRQVVLVPASVRAREAGVNDPIAFKPMPADDLLGAWLKEQLARVARATNLLRLAEAPQAEHARGASTINIELQLLKFDGDNDEVGEAVGWEEDGITLKVGDVIAVRAHNKGRTPVDVSFLFVDSSFGIELFFPEPGTSGDNRLLAGASLTTPKAAVTSATMGLEHMVVIAVKARAENEPVDFSFLAQSSLERARNTTRRSGIERLLDDATRGASTRAGPDAPPIEAHKFHVFSWRTTDR